MVALIRPPGTFSRLREKEGSAPLLAEKGD